MADHVLVRNSRACPRMTAHRGQVLLCGSSGGRAEETAETISGQAGCLDGCERVGFVKRPGQRTCWPQRRQLPARSSAAGRPAPVGCEAGGRHQPPHCQLGNPASMGLVGVRRVSLAPGPAWIDLGRTAHVARLWPGPSPSPAHGGPNGDHPQHPTTSTTCVIPGTPWRR